MMRKYENAISIKHHAEAKGRAMDRCSADDSGDRHWGSFPTGKQCSVRIIK
jgi:hypothetical protein